MAISARNRPAVDPRAMGRSFASEIAGPFSASEPVRGNFALDFARGRPSNPCTRHDVGTMHHDGTRQSERASVRRA